MKNITNYFNSYETVKDEIKFLVNSEIRLRILNCLSYTPFSMRDIHKNTGLSYSSISSNIHKLEEKEYIFRKSGKYYLKNLIKLHLGDIIYFNESINVVNDYWDFWKDHDIKSIGDDYLNELFLLKDSKIIKSDYCDIYKTHNVLKELLMDVTDVKLILPFFHQDYKFIFEHLIENNVNIELLLSETIVSIFLKNLNSEILKIAIDKGNIKIKSVKNDVKIALTVANNFMTLGLFKLDETYDQNRILVSNEKLAIEWGKNLFKKHEKNGNKLYYSL